MERLILIRLNYEPFDKGYYGLADKEHFTGGNRTLLDSWAKTTKQSIGETFLITDLAYLPLLKWPVESLGEPPEGL